jgi:hypothetical protein
MRARQVSTYDEFLPAIDTEFNPHACSFARLVEAVFPLADDSFEMLFAHSREEFGRLSLHVIDNLYSLVLECQCFQQFTSLDERQFSRVPIPQTEQVKDVVVYAGCASPKILKQIKVWPALIVDGHDFAIYDRAGRHARKGFHDVTELAVEGSFRAGIEIYAVGLDGNRSVTVDFYFPNPVRGVWKLRYRQAVHRRDERGVFVRQGCQSKFWRHAGLGISRSTRPHPAVPYQSKPRPFSGADTYYKGNSVYCFGLDLQRI